MDLIKNLLDCQTVNCQMIIGLKKNEYRRMRDESVFVYPEQFSKLSQEEYVPSSRRLISQLQTALHPFVAKPFAEIRSKVVPPLSWSGFVKKWHMDRVKLIGEPYTAGSY